MDAQVLRLPLHKFHELDGLQSHRHHAAYASGEGIDDAPVRIGAGHHRVSGVSGPQHLEVSQSFWADSSPRGLG